MVMAAFVGLGLAWAELAHSAYSHEAMQPTDADAAAPTPVDVPASRTDRSPPHAEACPAPPRIWLVDGFNVLHVALLGGRERREWWTQPSRQELLDRAAHFDALHGGADAGAEVWVVFDGPRPADDANDPVAGSETLRLRQVFAPCADAWLLDRLRKTDRPEGVVIVTADRRLAARVRSRGARVVPPGEFLRRCVG